MNARATCLCLSGAVLLVTCELAQSATAIVINADSAGEGLNDPAPRAAEGGNAGTTLGQQRLIAVQAAADAWAAQLESNVQIRISVQFNSLGMCNATSGTVGFAGPAAILDFGGSPPPGAFADTYYPIALAEALSGINQNGTNADISAQFNSDVDGPICFGASDFYYGITPGPTPGGRLGFLPVALHEFGHGLGFAAFLCVESTGCGPVAQGDFTTPGNTPDIWSRFAATLPGGTLWIDQNTAARAASVTSDPNLVWTGANVTANAGSLSQGTNTGFVRLHAPNPVQSGSSVSHFSAALFPNDVMEPVISTGAISLDPGRAVQLMEDIGWNYTAPVNPDRVFADGFEP